MNYIRCVVCFKNYRVNPIPRETCSHTKKTRMNRTKNPNNPTNKSSLPFRDNLYFEAQGIYPHGMQCVCRSCVKVEVAVLGSPSLIVIMVSVDVKQH